MALTYEEKCVLDSALSAYHAQMEAHVTGQNPVRDAFYKGRAAIVENLFVELVMSKKKPDCTKRAVKN
jgi:hypothetical protein